MGVCGDAVCRPRDVALRGRVDDLLDCEGRMMDYSEKVDPCADCVHCSHERLDDCPLVPVPEHGDLIDYDFCMENYELLHDDDGNPVYAVKMRDINRAPTIIPAEEGK